MKRMLALAIALMLALGCAQILSDAPGSAAVAEGEDGITARLNALKSRFPHGKFWNHVYTEESNAADVLKANGDNSYSDKVTDSPCHSHHMKRVPVGTCDCNAFDGAIQCYGFANKIFYEVFGQHCYQAEQRSSNIEDIRIGDHIRFTSWGDGGHSAIVYARNGNTLTLAEGNFNPEGYTDSCMIYWGRTVGLYDKTIVGYYRATNWEQIYSETRYPLDMSDARQTYILYGSNNLRVAVNPSSGNVELANPSDSATQMWSFEKQSDGSYIITSLYDGRVLDVAGAGTASGTNVQVYARSSGVNNAQRWYVYLGTGGNYIVPRLAIDKALDATGAGTTAGTNLQIYSMNDSAAQKYTFYYQNSEVLPTSVSIGSGQISMKPGETRELSADVLPSGVNASRRAVTWSSSNAQVATVSGGVIRAVSEGTATITATNVYNQSLKAMRTVVVESPVQVPEITDLQVDGLHVRLAWSASPLTGAGDQREYEVFIYPKGNIDTYVWSNWHVSGTSCDITLTEPGEYVAYVRAINASDETRSAFSSRGFAAVDDSWLYCDTLPENISDYEVEYHNHYQDRESATSPGDGWVRGASHTTYTNTGVLYSPDPEPLATSDTLVYLGTYYYHYCDGSGRVEHYQTGSFTHETVLDDNGQFEVVNQYKDDADPRYVVYRLKWISGQYAGGLATCPYGSAEALALYYRGYRYQQRTANTTYTWTKEDAWSAAPDPSADSVTYRVRQVRFENTLNLPAGTTAIDAEAFMNDTRIQAVVVPDGCASIGSRAFAGCTGLKRAYIPAATAVAADAFDGCPDVQIIRTGE